jgi:hypothetical protein
LIRPYFFSSHAMRSRVKSSECFATSKRPRRIPCGSFGDMFSFPHDG